MSIIKSAMDKVKASLVAGETVAVTPIYKGQNICAPKGYVIIERRPGRARPLRSASIPVARKLRNEKAGSKFSLVEWEKVFPSA